MDNNCVPQVYSITNYLHGDGMVMAAKCVLFMYEHSPDVPVYSRVCVHVRVGVCGKFVLRKKV